jgi:CheY-like chemotaxis protein
MRVLVADDDRMQRLLLEATLRKQGYDPLPASDGAEALSLLSTVNAPSLAILDWEMPELDGPAVCRRLRARADAPALYVILLTARTGKSNMLQGLDAGADDYLSKPFDADELLARIRVGARLVTLQQNLAHRVQELAEALASVKQLQGLLPICCYCKNIRSDGDYWQKVEHYLAARSEVQFSHAICPTCYAREIEPQLALLQQRASASLCCRAPGRVSGHALEGAEGIPAETRK